MKGAEIEGKARPGAVKPKGRGGHGSIHGCWQRQASSRAVDAMAAARSCNIHYTVVTACNNAGVIAVKSVLF